LIVVDASVVVTALADDGLDGERHRARLAGERLAAPHLLDIEVVSAWRRLAAGGRLDDRRAALARADLRSLPVRRVPHAPLLERCWELRANLTAYDAAYVALAELIGAPLLTADAKLVSVPGVTCAVEVLGF
jgi:predicted nucleic acid-binding protein